MDCAQCGDWFDDPDDLYDEWEGRLVCEPCYGKLQRGREMPAWEEE